MQRIIQKIRSLNNGYHIASAVFAFVASLMVFYYLKEGSLPLWMGVSLLLLRIVLLYFFCLFVFCIVNEIMSHDWIVDKPWRRQSAWKVIVITMMILIIVWLPFLVIKYPGASCWDTNQMLIQFRTGQISSHHSLLYTYLIGSLVDVFEKDGHPNRGLFVFVVIHYLFLAFSFSYATGYLWKRRVKYSVIIGALVYWVINPHILGYIGVAMKDIPYAACMVLLTTLFMELTDSEAAFSRSPEKMILLFSVIVLSCLIRKNGIYLASSIIVYLIIQIIKRRNYLRCTIIVLAGVVMFGLLHAGMMRWLNADSSSVAETLSVPLQQTARYVTEHEDDVTDDERAVIDSVIDYKKIKSSYTRYKSDAIKGTYRGNSGKLPEYFKVWWRQLLRHPASYLAAYCDMYYYTFIPSSDTDNISLYRDYNIGYEAGKLIDLRQIDRVHCGFFSKPEKLETSKSWIVAACDALYHSIVVGTVSNIAVCVWIMLFLFAKLLIDRKKCGLVFLPCLVALVFAVVGPAVYGHSRYLFPVVYTLPMICIYEVLQYSGHKAEKTGGVEL